jgi:hypothetical protein
MEPLNDENHLAFWEKKKVVQPSHTLILLSTKLGLINRFLSRKEKKA